MVSPAGFEPAPSSSRTTRARLLRYSEMKSMAFPAGIERREHAAPPRGRSARCTRGGASLPHPSCKRAGESAFAFAQKSGTPPGIRTRKIVLLRHARIPIPPAGRIKNKKPGDLAAHPGLKELPAMRSLEDLLRSGRARTRLAQRDGLWLLLKSEMPFRQSSIHIRSSCAVLAAASTPQKQKARSARAVRAADGRKALTRSSSPDRRRSNVVSSACSWASGRAFLITQTGKSREIRAKIPSLGGEPFTLASEYRGHTNPRAA